MPKKQEPTNFNVLWDSLKEQKSLLNNFTLSNIFMKKTTVSIPQIHCPSCEKLVKMSLQGHKGVSSVNVNITNKTAEINYDTSLTSIQEIKNAITETTGYAVEGGEEENNDDEEKHRQSSQPMQSEKPDQTPTTSQMISLDIEGMYCSSCALLIEKSLKKVPGVQQANVNFSSSQAMVKVSPKTSTNELIKAVQNAGYEGSIQDINHKDETEKRQKETKHWWRKFSISALLSIPMIAFMFYDFFPGILP